MPWPNSFRHIYATQTKVKPQRRRIKVDELSARQSPYNVQDIVFKMDGEECEINYACVVALAQAAALI
jgi:hypothetical protein